jgi:hypothetical protein
MQEYYTGNKLLEVLGEDRSGEVVKKVREQYSLDKNLKNVELVYKAYCRT